MKFIINRQELLSSIQEVTNAISPRSAVIPILSGMKLDLKNDILTLTGSNSDITIQSSIPSKIDDKEIINNIENGSIVLPVPHFPDIIKKLPGDQVEIEVKENNKTVIQSQQSIFELHGRNSEDYPNILIDKTTPDFAINPVELKQLIRQTVFSVSTMETRPILTGVHMSIVDNRVRFTATDTHRLAENQVEIETKNNSLTDLSIVIPGQSLLDLNKIIHDDDQMINISVMKNQILFFTERTSFVSRLLSGTYPDTERLIPTDLKTTIHIPTNEFIKTIERAALLASSEQNNVVRFKSSGESFIEISSNSPKIGRVNEEMEVISHEGEEVSISFSSKYLLEALKTINHKEVVISFTGPMNPFVIKTPDNENLLHLILPVRTY